MSGRIVFRVVAALVLLAVIAGIGWYAFNLGAAQNVQVSAGQPSTGTYPNYSAPFWHPFGFLGFGCFGLLFPFFLVLMAFCALRRMLWGPRWGHMHGRWHGENGEWMPPMFREWHRRAHEEPADQKKD
jgi:TRAP-type C4-dicarboxylate transport system permease small subunit